MRPGSIVTRSVILQNALQLSFVEHDQALKASGGPWAPPVGCDLINADAFHQS
jgi:hypothetical protein